MTLEILQSAMIAAMKDRNKARKDSISSLIGAIKNLLSIKTAEITSQKN